MILKRGDIFISRSEPTHSRMFSVRVIVDITDKFIEYFYMSLAYDKFEMKILQRSVNYQSMIFGPTWKKI